ncbi:hypothetical protein JAAARDRAFT_111763, partial [Jaapia argillacea MUCL 33604]
PNIRRFVYEFATIVDRIFCRFIRTGITASGHKLVVAAPAITIVGTIVSAEGRQIEHGLVNKVLKWP